MLVPPHIEEKSMILVNSLLLGSIVLMIARVYLPWIDRPNGKILSEFSVPFKARVRLQRMNIYAVVVLLALGIFGGWLSTLVELVIIFAVMAVLYFVPVRYALTDEGIYLGRTPIRRWIEFNGVELKPNRAVLRGANDWRDMDVWLPRNAQDDGIVALLRRKAQQSTAANARDKMVTRSIPAGTAKSATGR
jgi:hypothetical protein